MAIMPSTNTPEFNMNWTQSTAPDEAEIEALNQHLATAIRARDINAVMSAYAPDETLAVFNAISPLQYVGAKACKKNWENALAFFSGSVEYQISDLSIKTDGSLGFSRRIDHMVLSDKSGRKLSLTLRITCVYRRINGRWLIVHEHASAPVDLVTGEAESPSK
jgi:ketosteroid isomerase-like protein